MPSLIIGIVYLINRTAFDVTPEFTHFNLLNSTQLEKILLPYLRPGEAKAVHLGDEGFQTGDYFRLSASPLLGRTTWMDEQFTFVNDSEHCVMVELKGTADALKIRILGYCEGMPTDEKITGRATGE